MDIHIDTDPRIVRCGEDAAHAREILLFAHRLVFIDGNDGWLDVKRMDVWYLSRMLFMTVENARAGLGACFETRLLQLSSNGRIVTDRYARYEWADHVPGGDRVLIADWCDEYRRKAMSPSERQANFRDRENEKRIQSESTACEQSNGISLRVTTIDQTRSDQTRDRISLVPDSSGTVENKADVGVKLEARAHKIPERAWYAADALRRMVIDRNPHANIAAKPWDGRKRPRNAVDIRQEIAPTRGRGLERLHLERCGWRLKWADEIRKIVEIDGRSYEDVFDVMQWIRHEQPKKLGTGFIVESPASLREKWGAIWMHITEGRQRRNGSSHAASAEDSVAQAVAEVQAAIDSASKPDEAES